MDAKQIETMKQEMGTAFKNLPLEDLKELKEILSLEIKGRSEEAKVAAKEAKEAAKQAGEALKDQVKVGSRVRFTYKGREVEAVVAKVTDKTFHVDAEVYGLDFKKGGQKFRYVQFSHLLSVAEAEAAVAA